jgi:hypothetical protein
MHTGKKFIFESKKCIHVSNNFILIFGRKLKKITFQRFIKNVGSVTTGVKETFSSLQAIGLTK